MKKKLDTILRWQMLIGTVVLFAAIQLLQQYILFDIEQLRVFVYEADKIVEQLSAAGGVADFLALWIQQFFKVPYLGPLLLALVIAAFTLCIQQCYKTASGHPLTLAEALLCWLPAVCLFVYTEDKLFFTTGHLAMMLSSAACLLIVKVCQWEKTRCDEGRCPWYLRILTSLILIPSVILLAGFACSTCVWPAIVCAFVYTLIYNRSWQQALIIILSAALMVGLAQRLCLAVGETELFSPDVFTYRTKVVTCMSQVWLSQVLVFCVPFALKLMKKDMLLNNSVAATVAAAMVLVATAKTMYSSHSSEDTIQRLELEHQLLTGDHIPAYEFCLQHLDNFFTANIYCMLEATAGTLPNAVRNGIIQDPRQMVMPPSKARFARKHLMTLYYNMGYVLGAQREAFEYNEPTEGMMAPEAVKILALTNLAQGNYAAAEKYITHLEHTLFYRKWAAQYRPFLYNDKAVEKSPELGPRRRSLVIESVPEHRTTMVGVIRQIAYVAPELPAKNYYDALLAMGLKN
ncbi:MAG: hypothetical protein HUK08_06705 [Bacteroidaceae bacterium]|nr:hypothetical protein [Bacteroidaceae bacterium]